MGLSHHDTLVLLGLLVGIGGLVALSPLTRIPYPIFLVLGGLALGFVPGLPRVTLRPEYVLVGVLPALLYASAFFTSLRDLRRNMRSIGLLAIGLVAATGPDRRGRRARVDRTALGSGVRARRGRRSRPIRSRPPPSSSASASRAGS